MKQSLFGLATLAILSPFSAAAEDSPLTTPLIDHAASISQPASCIDTAEEVIAASAEHYFGKAVNGVMSSEAVADIENATSTFHKVYKNASILMPPNEAAMMALDMSSSALAEGGPKVEDFLGANCVNGEGNVVKTVPPRLPERTL